MSQAEELYGDRGRNGLTVADLGDGCGLVEDKRRRRMCQVARYGIVLMAPCLGNQLDQHWYDSSRHQP